MKITIEIKGMGVWESVGSLTPKSILRSPAYQAAMDAAQTKYRQAERTASGHLRDNTELVREEYRLEVEAAWVAYQAEQEAALKLYEQPL
jgi:hypothetical protein